MDYAMILNNNYNIKEKSFLYYLHEKNTFDILSYWELYNSIVKIGESNSDKKLDIGLLRKVNCVYISILKLFLYNMDLKDCYKIEGFPQENYASYIERLDVAVDSCFSRNKINDDMFQLKRPI